MTTPLPDDIADPAALPPEFDPATAPGEPTPLPVSANPDPTPAPEPVGILDTLKSPPLYAKALAAAALAFVGAAATASADGFTSGEWWAIAGTTVAAFVGVYATPNAD